MAKLEQDLEAGHARVEWVDYAKGICICLVVMMHSTLGVEKAMGEVGYLGNFIAWAKPFRMPDFFLISGLFLARRIDVSWRSYLDTKLVHFAYFYILWMTIQFGFKGPGLVASDGLAETIRQYGLGFIDPFGTLWFIYLLAIFFVVTKLLRNVPHWMVFLMAAFLEMLPLHTGWVAVDEFAARYVYFFAGYWLAAHIFKAADTVWRKPALLVLGSLYVWSTAHSLAIVSGVAELPGLGLVLGFAGCAAVVATAVLLARSGMAGWLRYLGANSIVVYLAFFLFMAATRSAGLKLYPAINVDALAALTSAAGIVGPVLLFWSVQKTPLRYLFKRPDWAKWKPVEVAAQQGYTAGHAVQNLSQPQTR
jgi:uncharacterized membrane protein YcfT